MSDKQKKNEFQNDKQTEKKMFEVGGKPGPGRGNTRKMQEISEAIEEIKELLLDDDVNLTSSKALAPLGRILLHGITSKDLKVRNDSMKLYFSWSTKMLEAEAREADEGSVSPGDLNSFARAICIKQDLDVIESEGISDLLCFECKRKLGIDEGSKENDQC